MPRDPVIDALYEEDEPLEEYPVRAIQTMPFWGQLLAWLAWRMSLKVYGCAILVGIGGCFWILPLGVVVMLLGAFALFGGFYCRTNHPSPWTFAVIQTRAPVPGELRQAAAEGRPVPPEHPDAVAETET